MKHFSGIYMVGIRVAFCLSVAASITGEGQAVKSSACYPPPKDQLWRMVRKDNTTALEAVLARHPAELSGRFACLRNQTLLHQAAAFGAHHNIGWLLARGALLEAPDQDGRTPLLEAARSGQTKSVRLLLERGAEPGAADGQGRSALHLGAGHPRVLEKLLRARGVRGLLEGKDAAGDTPLHRAAAAGSGQAVLLLVRAGAGLDPTNAKGETPLHLSLAHRRLNATRTLLEKGADPNVALEDGRSPLHLAVAGNGLEAARLLLQHGAKVNSRGGRGQETPLGAARRAGRDQLAELLVASGGVQ